MNVPYMANLTELVDVSPESAVFFPGDDNNKAGIIYRGLDNNYWRSAQFLKITITKGKKDDTETEDK